MTDRRIGYVQDKIAPPRFVVFVLILISATAIGVWRHGLDAFQLARAFMWGFDAAALVFLISLAPLLRAHSTEEMRQHAADNDANRLMLLIIAVAVTAAILAAVAVELQAGREPNKALVIATLALAWLFANMVFALHYAHVYYLKGSKGGLDFSGSPDNPDYSDFIYFAFTLGMTFQTSDTGVQTRALRRVVTLHCLAAFTFNIGVLAFTINVLGSG